MAKFLDTQAISNELMKLIKEAKEKIMLISYSFKVNPQIQERLKTKSKIGNLSEIVIVYGKTELKQVELAWIKEIQDLKIYEKPNLHAKCYLSEDRAIICSMNLYDYSQQNNIEMGILITKAEDKKAYEELMEEINNIKVNGIRKNFAGHEEKNLNNESFQSDNRITAKAKEEVQVQYEDLSLDRKLTFQLLKEWRLVKSKSVKINAFHILTDQELNKLIGLKKLDKSVFFDILPKKNAIHYADEIIEIFNRSNKYTIGNVVNVRYQSDNSKYDKVKLKIIKTGEERWFDTTQELPDTNKVVAVRLNGTWFNEYLYLNR